MRTGEVLVAYVYVDPTSPPQEIMLQWNDGSWEHRAYWGANIMTYGVDGTVSRRYRAAIPTPGKWVRLEIPAHAVGLEGRTLKGMAFSIYGGRTTWDHIGKAPRPTAVRMTIQRAAEAAMQLSWESEPSQTYRVQCRSGFDGAGWSDLDTVTAEDTQSSWTDNTATTFQRFYRVIPE